MISSAKNYFFIGAAMIVFLLSCEQQQQATRFVSEEQHQDHLKKLNAINAQMISDLDKYGVNDNSALSLNFYFVTDDSLKAQQLSQELEKSGYHANTIHSSPKDHSLWVLTGNSASVSMDSASVNKWTASICEVGYKHDCEFQGWNPVSE